MNLVQMKEMDLVINIDGCSCKKEGKGFVIYPKLQVVNIIMRQPKEDARMK